MRGLDLRVTSLQSPSPRSPNVRALTYLGRMGSLSTLSRKQPGFPFGSVMPYGLDDHGRPIFLISTMAMHTQNLQADPRASLLVTQEDMQRSRWKRRLKRPKNGKKRFFALSP
jgi:putative heme iron utilization protein